MVIKKKNYSGLSKVKKIGAVFLRFIMMHEQIENIENNKGRYVDVLEKFTSELEARFSYSMRVKFHFQQDGAPPHTSKLALDWLKSHFNNRVISRKTDFEWAPHSPDLSPPDFFLWGYMKDQVYKTSPQTIGELKRNIQTEMEAIDEATCRAVMSNFIRRMEMCQHQEGGHLEQLL